jgi:hypothetical protein
MRSYGAWRVRVPGCERLCACPLPAVLKRSLARLLLTLAHCARAGAIPAARGSGPKVSRRKPTTLGLVLYAAVMVVGTVALIAVLMTVDGGRLEQIVGLQAPQARAARGVTAARGRRPPQQHLQHRAAAGKGMNVRSMGLHEEGDEEGEEHAQECICDDPMHCYVCFVHEVDHGKHGHEDHGHDDHGHDDHGDHEEEHHHEKALRAQKLARTGTMLDEHGEHDEHHGDDHGKMNKKAFMILNQLSRKYHPTYHLYFSGGTGMSTTQCWSKAMRFISRSST